MPEELTPSLLTLEEARPAKTEHFFSWESAYEVTVHYEPDPLEVLYGRPLPAQLIRRYAMLAAHRADTERLEDGSWYAEIRNFPGAWAQADSEEGAIKELETVVRDWTLLKIQDKDRDLPVIDEIDLNIL